MPFFARVVRFDLGEVRHQLEFALDFRGFEVVKAAAQPGLGRWRRHEVLASLAKRRRRDVHGVFLVFTSTSAIGVPAQSYFLFGTWHATLVHAVEAA